MPQDKRLAICMSDKKFQKLNFKEFGVVCGKYGFEAFKLNLSESLESQEPFCVLLHKLTDTIVAANEGNLKNLTILSNIEKYILEHPNLSVIDPLPNIRKLLDRYTTYSIINSTNLHLHGVFTPNFCELKSSDISDIKEELQKSNITYPFLCKAVLGHGSKHSHKMSIIFNEEGLKDCKIPSVAQSFIKHNAILYKIFTVSDKYAFVERPSLKNYNASDRETIFFESASVSKAGSQSELSILDPEENISKVKPDIHLFEIISKTLCNAFGMDLLGIDVVIENDTRKYGIIDVNAYPGYDGFPDFYECLLKCITRKLRHD